MDIGNMEIETDDALIGIGKLHRVMVWDGQREREKQTFPFHGKSPFKSKCSGEKGLRCPG